MITELFEQQSAGMVTSRDLLTLHDSLDEAKRVTADFMALQAEEAREKYQLGKDVQDWKVEWAQADLRESCKDGELDESKFCRVSYRCFDVKYSYYTGKSRGFYCRPRYEVMQYMTNTNNIAFVTVNRQPAQNPVGYYFVADSPVSNGYIRSDSVSIDTAFPLYIYSEGFGKIERIVNFNKGIVGKIENGLGASLALEKDSLDHDHFSPEDLLSYIYAVLYSEKYRERYSEFLKIEYPRVPYPQSIDVFWQLVDKGRKLIDIHLMRCDEIRGKGDVYAFYDGGNHTVEKTASSAFKDGRVYINKNSYFTNVSEEQWNQYIGGYMPLQKWLKDRKGKVLSGEEISHYSNMVAVLKMTKNIMKEIDEIDILPSK